MNNHDYISPIPRKFPIIGWGPCRGDQTPTQAAFTQMRECGFNVAMLTGPYEEWNNYESGIWKTFYENAFNYADAEDMAIIVNSAILRYDADTGHAKNWRKRLVEAFKNEPNLGGWQIMDEPTYNDFINKDDGTISNLLIGYNEVYELDPYHMTFFNLAAYSDGDQSIGSVPYETFLNNVNAICHPPVWSYDFYPVTSNSSVSYNYLFKFLDLFVNVSKSTGKPFWTYVLSNQHSVDNKLYPFPTEGIIRFQAFIGLAFGAQGLVFYTYSQPTQAGSHAPVDENGNKTSIWYNLQTVISEIKKWSYIFLGSELVNRYISRTGTWTGNNLPLDKITYNGPGVLVTTLRNGNKNYMIVVSLDPFNEQVVTTYRQSTKPDKEIGLPLQPSTPDETKDGLNSSQYITQNRTLKPGGYLLYSI